MGHQNKTLQNKVSIWDNVGFATTEMSSFTW